MAVLVVAIVGLGLYPQPVFDEVAPGLSAVQHSAAVSASMPEHLAERAP